MVCVGGDYSNTTETNLPYRVCTRVLLLYFFRGVEVHVLSHGFLFLTETFTRVSTAISRTVTVVLERPSKTPILD